MSSRSPAAPDPGRKVVMTVFIALVLDLLGELLAASFPPSLLDDQLTHSSIHHAPPTLPPSDSVGFRQSLLSISGSSVELGHGQGQGQQGKNWDVVLLGGAMGSLFSFCQCIVSPWLGSLSDRHGRKKVLLGTMMGNLLSAAIWLRSTTFASYLLSRLVGGLSEGNVQLSTAIISDVTSATTRSKSLALVGIAFSICFTLGPSLGAYFASRPIPLATAGNEASWNVYALPAGITLVLLLVETLYLAGRLPETKDWQKSSPAEHKAGGSTGEIAETLETVDSRLARLRVAGTLHGLFLLFFSGAEFTVSFLTWDLFGATNAQNGRLLSFIGILSALLQARHVRPSLSRLGEIRLASYGVFSCILALACLSTLPLTTIRSNSFLSTTVLYAAATCLAYTSATVVTSLTAAAASCCDEQGGRGHPALQRGRALGGFRSRGQLGRAIGPILASTMYWLLGPTAAYGIIATAMAGVWMLMGRSVREERDRRAALKSK
ncbi:hypothetical protein EHS25_004503 [Saitozyma podzolica]|uniref:Major facilitator superfamily (MFS) profile domain-containing protein n=1 Tax=Saitozyma podzolica TaxID=1890683 RepID=A0A427YU83_9TREE|nr:hypothetical protein EHS25_004503 [Saitozyma podzolica]